jgi:hypothetical protein
LPDATGMMTAPEFASWLFLGFKIPIESMSTG